MKLVHIDANTEVCRNSFAENLQAFTDKVKAGTVQLGVIGYLDRDGNVNFSDFSDSPGPLSFRILGLLEVLKLKIQGVAHG